MIVGIGTDIVQIPRIERLLKLYGQHFINKILAQEEIQKLAFLHNKLYSNFLAKRFAAKEAVGKAFGIGIGDDFSFKDIAVLNDDLGKPFVKISPRGNPHKFQQFQIHLSISDDYPVAIAFVVISKLHGTTHFLIEKELTTTNQTDKTV